jgi:hypothetical protein
MTTIWKPNADQLREIRAWAALVHDNRRPGGVVIEAGERANDKGRSLNIVELTGTFALEDTDLHDYVSWSDFRARGVPLYSGVALVDFYVSEKGFGERGELLGNVQAVVMLQDNKPTLVELRATGGLDKAVNI